MSQHAIPQRTLGINCTLHSIPSLPDIYPNPQHSKRFRMISDADQSSINNSDFVLGFQESYDNYSLLHGVPAQRVLVSFSFLEVTGYQTPATMSFCQFVLLFVGVKQITKHNIFMWILLSF